MFVMVKQPCKESAVAARYAFVEIDSNSERCMQLSMLHNSSEQQPQVAEANGNLERGR